MTKLKTIMIGATMLLGMGLVVPQAIAGGSALATYKLPFGLEFNKPIPQKIKNRSEFNKATSDYSAYYNLKPGDVHVHEKNNVFIKLTFDDKEPRVFKQLGLKIAGKEGSAESKVRSVIRQQGGTILDDDNDGKKTRIRTIFGSSAYEFTFVLNEASGLVWVEIMEQLGEF